MSRSPKFLNLVTLLLLLPISASGFSQRSRAQTDPSPASLQQPMPQLELGKETTATIEGDEIQTYEIPLKKGQYLHLRVKQKSADVIVTLLDPEGEQVLEVDGTGRSEELILAIAEKTGNYRLQVQRYEKDALEGNYAVKLVELKTASQGEREKVNAYLKAEEAYEEGITLYNEEKAESYQQALGKFQEAFSAYQQVEHPAMAGVALYNIGQTYQNLEDYPKALAIYQEVLSLKRKQKNKRGEGLTLWRIGQIYQKLEQPREAITAYEQSLQIDRELGNLAGEAIVLDALAATYKEMENYGEALATYQQVLDVERKQNNRQGEGLTLWRIGQIYQKLEQPKEAITAYEQSLRIYQTLKEPKEQRNILITLAEIYQQQGEKEKAEDSLQQVQAISEELGETGFLQGIEAQKLFDEGRQLYRQGTAESLQQAIRKLEEALPLWREVGDKLKEVKILGWIGFVYSQLAFKQKALEYYNQSLLICKKENCGSERTIANNIGRIYSDLGEKQKALDYFQQALTLSKTSRDRAKEAATLNNIGAVYSDLGEKQKALDYYQQALPLFEALEDRVGEAVTLNNIGGVYDDLGEKQKALDYFQQALPLFEALEDRVGEAVTLGNIGLVYSALGEKQKALDYYQQALPVLKAVGNRAGEATTLHNIGFVYSELGEKQKALDYYQQALPLRKAVGDRTGEATTLNNIGKVYSDLGEKQKALDYYQQALPLSKAVGDRSQEATILNNIGVLLASQNQPQLAIVFFKQSVNLYESLRRDIKGLSQEIQQSYTQTVEYTYRHLADILLSQDRILEAQRVLDLLKVQELDDYLEDVRGNQATETGIPNLPAEQELKEKQDQLLAKAIDVGNELASLRKREQKTTLTDAEQARIIQLEEAQSQLIEDFNNFIESEEVQQLIAQLTPQTRTPDLVDELDRLIGLQTPLEELQQNAVLFYPLILEDRLELILTTPNSPPIRRTVKISKTELSQAISDFRQALGDPERDARPAAQKLYQWLIAPLEADLTTAQAQTIIYAPDGILRYIPLAALHDGERWLVEKYRLNNITAFSLTNFSRQSQDPLKILAGAFVNGTYSFQQGGEPFKFNGLTYAGLEVEQLTQIVPDTTQLLDQAFNPQNTTPKMNANTVVHLATHAAIVIGKAEESFILFGDGTPVTIKDVRKWNLRNVDLVVLSACETGLGGNLGTGAEILGLGYQLERAGARSVIASLWTVDDRGTQLLMNAFYQQLRSGEVSKSEALRQAQLALIAGNGKAVAQENRGIEVVGVTDQLPAAQKQRLSHPYYWAPFILIGNGF